METFQAFLRVLYTVNSSPQYILAKSSSQVPAIACTEAAPQHPEREPTYARTPLKACLAAVCDSSPELLQDSARDFSLYVLDPLEAQPLPAGMAHVPHDTNSPRGVAVALGLMSWALESNDSTNVFVTGTIIPHASPALEIVFALRETKRIPRPVFHPYSSLGLLSAPQLPNPLHLPQVAGVNLLSTSQEQRTLTRSADFPELYIGPPRRARGRPEGSTSSKLKGTSQTRTSSPSGNTYLRGAFGLTTDGINDAGATPSKIVESRSESRGKAGVRPKQKIRSKPSRVPPKYSPFICAPLMRHTAAGGPESGTPGVPAFHQRSHSFSQNQNQSHSFHPQSQPYFHPTHNPLLGLLSGVPSTPSGNAGTNVTPEQQATLLSALQGLLATNPHLLQLVETNTGLSTSSGEQTTEKKMHKGSSAGGEHEDGDSDVVVLDSSTIDTTAFCKPSTWQLAATDHDTSPLTSQGSPLLSNRSINSSPLPASTPPSGQDNAPASSQTSTPTVTPEAMTPTSERQTERGDLTTLHALNIPETPTPSRARKRKLGEYIQGQAHLSTSTSSFSPSPSPSPSMTRTSSSIRGLTAGRVQSSPTSGIKPVSLPSARLPSMLGFIRTTAALGSRSQFSPLRPPTHRHPVSVTTTKSGNQSIALVTGPSKSKIDHPEVTNASSNGIGPDTTPLKRRCTLNEFMAEREARKSAKVRKRSSSGRRLEADVPANASQITLARSTNLVPTRHAHSSPPRPLFRSDSMASSLLALARQSILVPGAATSNPALSSTAMLACTTPSASTSMVAPTKNPLKNFVLPTWARTDTAMLPRLSEEALARQRTEREAKKVQVSLRRREAARAKRKRLRGAERPYKESSDDDDTIDTKLWTLHPSSSVARSVPLLPPPLPSLPVFASDEVEPIPSSPPQSLRQLVLPVVPSTPPGKPTSSGLAPHHTPNKSGSCSLFTPSGKGSGSLFTPSTPSVTRSMTRVTYTPRSPTMLRRSGTRKSPRKSVSQTPWTPKRSCGNHQTPISLRTGRSPQFVSPSLAIRTSQTQTGMGTRAFLLPPPSPCALRTPRLQRQVHPRVPGCPTPLVPEDSGTMKQESPSGMQNVEPDKGCKEDEMLGCEPGEDTPIPPPQWGPSGLAVDDSRGTGEPCDVASDGDASQAEVEYASSPLPPSSPLPISAFSSPEKCHDGNFNTLILNNLVVPDSDTLLPSASDSDGPQETVGATLLSDDACTASWLTDSEAGAWLTEETWLTDTEGEPHLTDTDAAWLSDSEAVFGDMSSSLPSSASKWLSDDADVGTDCEPRGIDSGLDAAMFERAFAALLERGGRGDEDETSAGGAVTQGRGSQSEFWESSLGRNVINEVGLAPGDVDKPAGEEKVAQDIQELLDGIVGTSM